MIGFRLLPSTLKLSMKSVNEKSKKQFIKIMAWYDIKVRSLLLKNEIFSAKFEKMKNGNKIYSSRALPDIYFRIYHVFYWQNKQKLYITYCAGWWEIILWVNINIVYLSDFSPVFFCVTIKMPLRNFKSS